MTGGAPPPGDDAPLLVEINTTPLVDVMLVLLVMLIITMPLTLRTVPLETPAPARADQPRAPVVRLQVAADGGYRWDDETLADRQTLDRRLQAAAAAPLAPEIHVQADPAAPYERVVSVLASAQRLGLVKVGLVGIGPAAPAR